VAVDDPKPADRNYLRIVLGIFMAAILATIVVGTFQYWSDKRDPDVASETSGQQ
jgi:TRAP-type C4-dicarboxylate transport system permease small subunit